MDLHIVAVSQLSPDTLRLLADGGYALYARGVADPDTLIFARATPPAPALPPTEAPAPDAAPTA